MLDLPRPVIRGRAPMSRESRAAQFSPFAALTGYDEMIEKRVILSERSESKDLIKFSNTMGFFDFAPFRNFAQNDTWKVFFHSPAFPPMGFFGLSASG